MAAMESADVVSLSPASNIRQRVRYSIGDVPTVALNCKAKVVLSNGQIVDAEAEIIGRRHPIKLPMSPTLLRALAPLLERAGKLPKGSLRGLLDSLRDDATGDPNPIRAILPRSLLSFRQAAEQALTSR